MAKIIQVKIDTSTSQTVHHWTALRHGKYESKGFICGGTYSIGQDVLKSGNLLHKWGFVDSQSVIPVVQIYKNLTVFVEYWTRSQNITRYLVPEKYNLSSCMIPVCPKNFTMQELTSLASFFQNFKFFRL